MDDTAAQPENPYLAPASDPGFHATRMDFPEIATPELKRLRNDSHSIRTVAVLMALGVVILTIVLIGILFGRSRIGPMELVILFGVTAWNLVTMVGLFMRRIWGGVMGFASGVIMLVGFPIGTLLGIFFLIALVRGGRLFGPDRLSHRALEAEWRYRKKNRVA